MKIKINELQGSALDWAVANCEGMVPNTPFIAANKEYTFKPSTNWADGGPIIEREGIALGQTADGWEATCDGAIYIYGKTPLIAAMRVYVASKLGDEVEVPNAQA